MVAGRFSNDRREAGHDRQLFGAIERPRMRQHLDPLRHASSKTTMEIYSSRRPSRFSSEPWLRVILRVIRSPI
jgi:hypothetical protein